MLLLQQFIGLVLIILVYGNDYCHIFFNPPEVVVEHRASFSVNCSTNVTDHLGLSWESSKHTIENIDEISTSVGEVIDWENNLTCYIFFNETECSQNVPVIIYKTPDRVSISTAGPMTEGNQYELQCDVHNVAPVQNLTVRWYKGLTLVNQTSFNDTIRTPVNKTATLLISPSRSDDGAQYRCEAELELGEEGPQPPPTVSSEPLNITVHYYCPIFFNPPEVVVEHGASFSVNCSTNVTDHLGLSWESSKHTIENIDEISTSVGEVIDWENNLTCYIIFNETECSQNVPVIIYKTPDRVSISTAGPMTEGKQYELQCDVHNVAPVQNLIVSWYKGQTLVNQTIFNDTIRTPVNETSTLLISPNRHDNGAQYRCEAELELGEEGPQPPPTVSSEPLNIIVHYSDCPLQLNPQSVVVRYGGSVSVDCSSSVPHDGMGWEASVGPVPMTRNNLITWRVSDLTDWNIEPPFCFINYNNKQCQLDLPVTVYKTPDRVSISTAGPMTEGNQYELQCDVHNVAPVQNLIVSWYKGPTLVDQTIFNDTIRTPVNKTATLLISPDRSDDGAQYRCEAELELGEEGPQPPPTVSSEPLNIIVHYSPQMQPCHHWSPLIGTLLVSYLNSYPVVGNPHPNISWRRKSSPVDASVPLTKHDSGQYEITASNEYGVSNCTINITVEYPTELNCTENYAVKEGTLFRPCVAYGSPEPVLTLYKDGEMIQLPYYPKWNESGQFHLIASNKHGTLNSSITINILHAPMFYNSQEHFFLEKDNSITLTCNSSGNPEPDMWWSFNNVDISTRRRQRHITKSIERATSTSAGVYTCSATNEFGHNNKTFTVEIRDNSPSYIAVVAGVVALFVLFFLLIIFLCRRKKLSGYYEVQPMKQYEMQPLSNGGPK